MSATITSCFDNFAVSLKMPRYPVDPDFVEGIRHDVITRLETLTLRRWKVTVCPDLRNSHIRFPDDSSEEESSLHIIVSESAIRRLLVRNFYRDMKTDRILLSRDGFISDVSIKAIQRRFNRVHDSLEPDSRALFRCPICSEDFLMVGRRWIVKQCPGCERWLAKGAYDMISWEPPTDQGLGSQVTNERKMK